MVSLYQVEDGTLCGQISIQQNEGWVPTPHSPQPGTATATLLAEVWNIGWEVERLEGYELQARGAVGNGKACARAEASGNWGRMSFMRSQRETHAG